MSAFSKVLVTGGAGFIGSRIVDRLTSEGYSVVVLDNLHSGKMENSQSHPGHDNFNLVKEDVREERAVRQAMDGADAVVHLAVD